MIEEEEFTKYLDDAVPWDNLSKAAQTNFVSQQQYQSKVLQYFYNRQKNYVNSLNYIDIQKYYSELISYGIENFLVFPYHLISELQMFNPITPFTYYIQMLLLVLNTGRSYDQSIPNFSAADALRETGVGRNEFIEAMQKSRSSAWSKIPKMKEKMSRQLLPSIPKSNPLQPWWFLRPVSFNIYSDPNFAKTIQKLSNPAKEALSLIVSSEPLGIPASSIEQSEFEELYNENLLYINIELKPDDNVRICNLNNFVMNRIGGDYLENLCYQTFISIDECTTIDQLSSLLDVDISEIARVLSLFIRLGVAELYLETEEKDDTIRRVAAIYDCHLPAALMLGNLGDAVKSYAVNFYEIGKVLDNSLPNLIQTLEAAETPSDDSVVESYERCQVIATVARFLRECGLSDGCDLLQLESLLSLDERSRNKLFEKHYNVAVALAPLTLNLSHKELKLPTNIFFGPPSPLFHSPWKLLYLQYICKSGPPLFIWPQGETVTTFPQELLCYRTVRLFKWGSEPIIVPTSTFLISVNDALPSSPVLIQGFQKHNSLSSDLTTDSSSALDLIELTEVIEPIDSQIQPLSPIQQKNGKNENNEKIVEVGFPNDDMEGEKEMVEAFGMKEMVGYISYIENPSGKRAILDITYGIPCISLDLCKKSIENIKAKELFSNEKVEKMKIKSEQITKDLEEFVKKWSLGVMRPVKTIFGVDGNIQWN